MTDPNPETTEPVDIDRLYGDHPPETPASPATPATSASNTAKATNNASSSRRSAQPRNRNPVQTRRSFAPNRATLGPALVRDLNDDVPVVRHIRRENTSDYSRPFLTRDIALNSNRAQTIFEERFPEVDNSLHVLCDVMPEIAPNDVVEQTLKDLENLFDSIEQDMRKVIEAMIKTAESRGMLEADQMTRYDHARSYCAPVRTPYASRYCDLMKLFDEINSRADAMWIRGAMTTVMRRQMLNKWLTTMRNFNRQIYAMHQSALAQAGNRAEARRRRAEEARRAMVADLRRTRANGDNAAQAQAQTQPQAAVASTVADATSSPAPVSATNTAQAAEAPSSQQTETGSGVAAGAATEAAPASESSPVSETNTGTAKESEENVMTASTGA